MPALCSVRKRLRCRSRSWRNERIHRGSVVAYADTGRKRHSESLIFDGSGDEQGSYPRQPRVRMSLRLEAPRVIGNESVASMESAKHVLVREVVVHQKSSGSVAGGRVVPKRNPHSAHAQTTASLATCTHLNTEPSTVSVEPRAGGARKAAAALTPRLTKCTGDEDRRFSALPGSRYCDRVGVRPTARPASPCSVRYEFCLRDTRG